MSTQRPPQRLGGRPPTLAPPRPASRLLYHRASDRAVLAAINDGGTLRLLRLETANHPELARLNDLDRATLQGAVLALLRRPPGGTRNATKP